jgi:Zn-dependent protease
MTLSNPAIRTKEETERIIDAVHQRFIVSTEYLREDSGIEFHLAANQENLKLKFLSLIELLRKSNDTAALRRTGQGFSLVIGRKPVTERRKSKITMILLVATLVTILSTGLIQAYEYYDPLTPHLGIISIVWEGSLYLLAIFGIIAIHELGHKVASWYHSIESSGPYFLPGIPGIWPTMGAVITARDAPVNRDALFDLGISGPLAGLAVTIIVSIPAVLSARLVSASSFQSQQLGSADFYTNLLIGALKFPSSHEVIIGSTFSLLYFAYSFGFLITFINLLPAWQLDGGHIMNAAVSPRIHKLLTYVSVLVMVLIQFYLMAILILLFSGRAPALDPLDNVSPLSPRRKAVFWGTWLLAGLIFVFVLYNNAFFGVLPFFR